MHTIDIYSRNELMIKHSTKHRFLIIIVGNAPVFDENKYCS